MFPRDRAFLSQLVSSLLSGSWTGCSIEESAPVSGSPHVTTVPSFFTAAKAPKVPQSCTT